MNSIMTSDDASKENEFLSAFNASPENFVHKALKDEQMLSKNRKPWERCFGHATEGIRQERYISVNFKSVAFYGPYIQRHIQGVTLALARSPRRVSKVSGERKSSITRLFGEYDFRCQEII